jgi:hypothetical protein
MEAHRTTDKYTSPAGPTYLFPALLEVHADSEQRARVLLERGVWDQEVETELYALYDEVGEEVGEFSGRYVIRAFLDVNNQRPPF